MPLQSRLQPAGLRERRLKAGLQRASKRRRRAGVASVDYALILGVILPMVTFIMWIGPKIVALAYEMAMVLISWPFM